MNTKEQLAKRFPQYAHLIEPCENSKCGNYRIGGQPIRSENGETRILGLCQECSLSVNPNLPLKQRWQEMEKIANK